MTKKKSGSASTKDAWQAFCEAMGIRCTFTDPTGDRCDNAVVRLDRCADHQEPAR